MPTDRQPDSGQSSTLFRCATNPGRICRAKFTGCCQRCKADNHNPNLHRIHRAAGAIGVSGDVLQGAIQNGALDG